MTRRPQSPASAEGARKDDPPAVPVEGGGGISVSWGDEGLVVRNTRPEPFWALLTGRADGTNRYAWVAVNDGESPTFGATLADGFAASGGTAVADLPAYEINGNQNVPTDGTTRVRLWPSGDLSYYTFAAPGISISAASGSGSGPSAGCDDAIYPLTTECSTGARVITAKKLGLKIEDGTLSIQECDSERLVLGPCSANSPAGTPTVVVNQVCPVYTTLSYTDADGNPATMQVVTSIRAKRRLIVAAIVDDAGCIESAVDACCGSGSGSGDPAKCTTLSHYCPDGQSTELRLSFADGSGDIAQLFYVEHPDDGNTSRWLSADGAWDLRYDADLAAYILTNLDTGFVWYVAPGFWNCDTFNTMNPVDPETQPNLQIDQVNDCTHGVGYVCVDGTCYEVPASLADFDTLDECEAACPPGSGSGSGSGSGGGGGSVLACGHTMKKRLYAHFTGSASGLGTVALDSTGEGTWASGGVSVACMGSPSTVSFGCFGGGGGGSPATFNLQCVGGGGGFDVIGGTPLSYTPFVWVASATAIGTCSPGAWGVTVDENP